MQIRPDIRSGLPTGLAIIGLLAGCATISPQPESEAPQRSPVLEELASILPGEYATPRSRDATDGRFYLQVHADRSTASGPLRLVMTQTRAGRSETPRRFEWVLREIENSGEERFTAEFAPLDSGGQPRRRCTMSVTLRRNGLTGQTDPEECKFGEGEQMTGLLKEIAFDGTQLVIADRLISLPGGEPLGDDQVTRFFPVRAFTGWAGVRDGGDGDWRMASSLAVTTASDLAEPVDAGEMSLGILVELAHYRMDRSEQVMLRLTVSDAESGDILGEAWADADAQSIGLARPDLQVGLDWVP